MTCDGCARHVEDALRQVPGVEAVQVPGWQSGQAVLSADPDVDESALVQAVAQAGYRAVPAPSEPSAPVQKGEADFDLIVIGTGGGGMAAAIRAAELGFRAAIIEGGTIGGTCVNIGCVPSKTLIRAAAVYHQAGHHRFAGLRTRAEGVDWPALIRQKDELVASLRQGKYVDVLASYSDNVTLIRGWASLKPGNRVVLDDGRVFSAAKIVIATGARPAVLPLPGIDQVDVLTSTTAMSLDKQPQSLIVLGGRAVALELGQAFARLGTQVTILQRSERIIPSYEPEIADTLTEALQAEGIAVHTGVSLQAIRVENGQKVVTAEIGGQTRQFRAEQVLMAVGRTPNTDRLGLEEVGVAVDERGFIQVNDRQQTTNPDIYAVGDVTTRPKLVYVAAAAGGIAATNALTGQSQSLDLAVLPEVIFTDPQVARVGITEAEARARGYNVRTTILPLEYVPRALAARDTRGLVKLVADAGSNRLLGAQVLAAEAGEVIQTAAMAVRFGLQFGFTIDDLTGMLFPYLTQVEGLKLAAQTFEKDVAQLSCCAG
ncbi:MAG: mercury(II) reductase [Chloroflexi bacterium]|nr:MAG: mercury(II) reductase [Chloroflexota bacterium]